MKSLKSIGVFALLSLVASESIAQDDPLGYVSAREAAFLVAQLVSEGDKACGNLEFDPSRPNSQGVIAMNSLEHQTALMVRPIPKVYCDTYRFTARQISVARDRIPVINNTGRRLGTCALSLKTDVPNYSSSVPAWAEVLQLIYGGANGVGDQAACSDPKRANLINNWAQLWDDPCEDGPDACKKLRFAFRQGDKSSATQVLKGLLGIQQFCNGAQGEDLDPLRTPCSESEDVDWCPDGTLGVVQPISLNEDKVAVFPLMGCVTGNFEYGFNATGGATCIDNTAPFAGFLCQFPRDCRNRFGCINSRLNGSTLNPFMDGRAYNYDRLDSSLAPKQYPDNISGAMLYFNGKCTGGRNGDNTGQQIGCLMSQIRCALAMNTSQNDLVGVTNLEPGPNCSKEFPAPTRLVKVNGEDFEKIGPGYPLSRPIYYSTLEAPFKDGQYECDKLENPEEQKFCRCVFNKTLVDRYIDLGINEPMSEYKVLECGAYE